MRNPFKKQELATVEVRDAKQELATVEVQDIKQYLVDEYERSQKLVDRIDYLNRELERAQEIKIKYDAALVTLDEYKRRLESQEKRLADRGRKVEELRKQLEDGRDELNTCKIQLSRAGITRAEIKEEIVAETKGQIAQSILAHKGGLSKTRAVEIIQGIVLKEEEVDRLLSEELA